MKLFAGATIMGDGKVALILDAMGMLTTNGLESDKINNVQENEAFRVLSCATGTKCCVVPGHLREKRAGLCVLQDCHGEVLSKRGLVRLLWKELQTGKGGPLLEKIPASSRYKLRSDLKLHMYVSDSPCGDASIYKLHHNNNNNEGEDSDGIGNQAARLRATGGMHSTPEGSRRDWPASQPRSARL